MMKSLIKIQSKSDIITNSSSEVFIVTKNDANAIERHYPSGAASIDYWPLNVEFLKNYPEEITSVYEALRVRQPFDNYYNATEEEVADAIEYIKPKLAEYENYVFLSIDDDFSGCEDAYEEAQAICIWTDYRY